MSVEERIRRCLILEEMRNNRKAAKELGLKNVSRIKSTSQHMGEVNRKGE